MTTYIAEQLPKRVEPATAVAIALSLTNNHKMFSEDSDAVKLVLEAIKQAGWKIVPLNEGES